MTKLNPHDIIESARQFARESRDELLKSPAIQAQTKEVQATVCQQRMEIVMDCYLTGFEATLKMLHGEKGRPYEWRDEVDHKELVTGLLKQFDLLLEG